MNLVNKTLISTPNPTCFLLNFSLTEGELRYILDPKISSAPTFYEKLSE